VAVLLCLGCTSNNEESSPEIEESAPVGFPADACVDVEGLVLGDVIPYSNVSLHQVPMLDFDVIMHLIKTTPPVMSSAVNESKAFIFKCLYPGKYVLFIPTSSFNHNRVGSPLPYEFDCEYISLRIAFQGGNKQYMVGAFSIEREAGMNTSEETKESRLSVSPRGRLQKECPLSLE
jgi:hypothetical protein